MRTGVFGGTFDPPHVGHLIVAQDAAMLLGLDRVLFVPAAQPPHKQDRPVTAAALRLAMLKLALAEAPGFEIDTLELDREGPSYTVDTLRELTARSPATEFVLLIGMDQYRELDSWRDSAEVRRLARIAALTRDGEAAASAFDDAAAGTGDTCVAVTRIDISSTGVRRRVRAGQPIRYMVPRAVEAFIHEKRLYAETVLR